MGTPTLLYLDSAVLFDIADGRENEQDVCDLLAAAAETETILVISPAHLADLLQGADRDTRRRWMSVVRRFPARAYFQQSPRALEESELSGALATRETERLVEQRDIALDQWTEYAFVALLELERYWRPLSLFFSTLTSLEAVARNFSREAKRKEREARPSTESARPFTHADHQLVLEAIYRAIASSNAVDAKAAMQTIQRRFNSRRIDALVAGVVLASKLVPSAAQKVAAKIVEDAEQSTNSGSKSVGKVLHQMSQKPAAAHAGVAYVATRGGHEGWKKAAAQFAPGLLLRNTLIDKNGTDLRRQARSSDAADEQHVEWFPYVAVATTDANNVAAIKQVVRSLPAERQPRIISNGTPRRLREIAAALRAHQRS